MEPLKLKKGHIIVYLVLLVLVLVVMLMARNAAIKGNISGNHQENVPCDTLFIAIQMSPVGVTIVGDSPGGYFYDKVKHTAVKAHFHPCISGITDVQSAIIDLDNGIYDIVIADTTGINLFSKHYATICDDAATDTIKYQLRNWAIICTNPQLANRIK